MDNAKVPASPQGAPGDIDIFLFSNGEALAPPRKYHLTALELDFWDSTLNFLARAHYGLNSTIDLYTIDGKKVETPLELGNNNTYVAVETKDTFLPGGYDQYLMRASKSWIKRYGSVSSSTTSKEKETTGIAVLEKVTEMKEMKEVEENNTEEITMALINTEVNYTNENHKTSKLPTKNNVQKPGEKRKPTPGSSILRKNIADIHSNGKNHLNAKDKPHTPSTLKKRPGSPPVKNANNKLIPPRKDPLIKALYSPGKPKHNSSQMASKNGVVSGLDTGPDFIVRAKLSSKPETQVQSEPIDNGLKKPEQDVDQVTEDEQYNESIKQILSPIDEILKRDINTRECLDIDAEKKVTDTLETIRENVDGYNSLTQNKKVNNDPALTKSFSTEMQHGDVIKLRLSVEVTQGDNKSNEDKSLPLMNNERWSFVIQEKSSQVNMDEIVFQKDTMKGILEGLQKNKPDATQKYVILHCDCCNNYFHDTAKINEDTMNIESNTVKRVINNKDLIVLLPYIKPDDDLLGCKCDEAVQTSDKIVQTSLIFETTEYSKEASCKQTVDQATDAPRSSLNVTTVPYRHAHISLCDQACGTSEVLFDNKVPPILPSKYSRTVPEQCPVCSNTLRTHVIPSYTNIYATPPPPKENPIVTTECFVCTNKSKEKTMLDNSTQTDTNCFLLEARKQADGHYSFHLPPLHRVKLYRH